MLLCVCVCVCVCVCTLQHIEDKNLLRGHIALILADYDKAQEMFLASSEPTAALEVS